MLDRTTTFMTAQALGLTEKYHAAMLEALRRLESGEIKHDFDTRFPSRFSIAVGLKKPVVAFDMATWDETTACGTVCCIGGLVDLSMGYPAFNSEECYAGRVTQEQRSALNLLYYPDFEGSFYNITVEQGACALRNYLTYGEARWKEVLA